MRTHPVIKQYVILVFALILPYTSYGQQEYFYLTDGKKVQMEIMENRFTVKPSSPVTTKQVEEYLSPAFTNPRAKTITGISGFYEISFDSGNFTKQAFPLVPKLRLGQRSNKALASHLICTNNPALKDSAYVTKYPFSLPSVGRGIRQPSFDIVDFSGMT